MSNPTLNSRHLADLHELADELGIERYRLLGKQELIAAIAERDPELEIGSVEESEPAGFDDDGGDEGPEADRDEERPPARRRSRSRGGRGRSRGGEREGRGGRGRGRDRDRDEDRDDEGPEEDEPLGEPVSGILDITPRGHGFIRLNGLEAAEGDIYVSPSQIRRCELARGDVVVGPARKPRRGERHPALVHIDTVNGVEPGAERSSFEDLTAVPAHRRLPLTGERASSEEEKVLLRSVDLLTPLARGQRVLVRAARGSGRTTLLRAIATELAPAEDLELVVVLVDERPEEERAWREAVGEAELAIATADQRPGDQLRVVELALAGAKRRAEAGADVVLIFDSLSRLAAAAEDAGRVKPVFGAGRETEEEGAGSLTVIATALTDEGDDGVDRALSSTENVTIALDSTLAEAGIYPALDVNGSRVSGEDSLREGTELSGARALRAELAGLPARDAAERLNERIAAAATNEALLSSVSEL
jgi:transcription termination factor Rho